MWGFFLRTDSKISCGEDFESASDDETTIGSASEATRERLFFRVSLPASSSEEDNETVEIERFLFRIAILCLRANAASLVAVSCFVVAMAKSIGK